MPVTSFKPERKLRVFCLNITQTKLFMLLYSVGWFPEMVSWQKKQNKPQSGSCSWSKILPPVCLQTPANFTAWHLSWDHSTGRPRVRLDFKILLLLYKSRNGLWPTTCKTSWVIWNRSIVGSRTVHRQSVSSSKAVVPWAEHDRCSNCSCWLDYQRLNIFDAPTPKSLLKPLPPTPARPCALSTAIWK